MLLYIKKFIERVFGTCFHNWTEPYQYARSSGWLCKKCGLEKTYDRYGLTLYHKCNPYNTYIINGEYSYQNPLIVKLKSLRIINKSFPKRSK